jgi:predicted ABC-type ATPase
MLSGGHRKFIEFDDLRADLVPESQKLIATTLSQSTHRAAPVMIHMCGIPGSGKTTYTNNYLANENSFSLVQFDSIMEGLPAYRRDKELQGPVEAFSRWELPARSIGYHLLQALIENRRDIFFDHSATNRQHIDLIRVVKKIGYAVEMHYIDCPPQLAADRVLRREKLIHRHTPPTLIYERHELLKELLPIYQGLVDKFVHISSSELSSVGVE